MRTLYRNGQVLTMDPTNPRAEAFVVEEERFLGAGPAHLLDGLIGPGDRVVDLGGRTVVPGLIDAHVHFSWFSFTLIDINLDGVATLEEALGLIRDRVARTPGGAWVRGTGFNANVWERWPTCRDLDMVAPLHRVVLSSKDCHSLWVNSLVLRDAGVTAATATPPGGEIIRDEHGEPTGIFKENAQSLIYRVMPDRTQEETLQAMRGALRYAHRVGITGLHCMDGIDCFRALQALQARGELSVRFFKQIPEDAIDFAIGAGLTTGFGNEWLRVGCVKMFSDGSLGSQTAYMLEGFEDRPDYLGVPTHTPESIAEVIEKAVRNNLAVAVHAIGDAANRMVLDALEPVAELSRRKGLRHRIEHAQLLTDDDILRFGELGVIASVQPSHAPSDRYIADKFWGDRSRLAYAFRSLLKSGARLAFGSDVPVEPLDPLAGLHAAVWRKRLDEPDSESWYPGERLSVNEALHGFTMGAAYASGEEQLKGSISTGKLADFVVLTHDISTGAEEPLRDARPQATVVGGRLMFGDL
ncbi:MAG TPA: amidohydrolase [Symbiobacteriaceae bacterium]|nr:amidohydrolase [Symbiobacteriaceae bacterium]